MMVDHRAQHLIDPDAVTPELRAQAITDTIESASHR
jgi:hypothetical protein